MAEATEARMSARRGIGGTDLSAVCAYYCPWLPPSWSKYVTAADVWMRLVHGVQRPSTAVMKRGQLAEPRLRRAYLDAYGGQMRLKPEPWIVHHPSLPFVTVSPDDVWSPNAGMDQTYVEFKSTSIFALYPPAGRPPSEWGDPESDVVPDAYGMQVQLGLEILDMETAHLFAGFGKDAKDDAGEPAFYYSETRRYVIHRNRDAMTKALALAERFHTEHIATRKPPSVEPRNCLRDWKRLTKEQSCTTSSEAAEAPSRS
jgi:hypothetical protein